MIKRISLFLFVNFLVVMAVSLILSLLNVRPYLSAHGLDLKALMIFCLVWGMVGALISLSLSKKMAKWLMRIEIISSQGAYAELFEMVRRLARDAGLSTTPEVGIFSSPDMNAFATGPTKKRSLILASRPSAELPPRARSRRCPGPGVVRARPSRS